jgi:hypothetical protein
MTTYTTQYLLQDVVYGQASGNYDGSSQDFYSDAVPAANYYGGQGSLQTITFRLLNFSGIITIEATLNDIKESATWFDVAEYDAASAAVTDYYPVNVTGNFVWLRARVQNFDSGEIDFVSVAY